MKKKDKFLESLRSHFKQLDFFVTMVAYLALMGMIGFSFLLSIGVMRGCICLSNLINLLLVKVSNKPKVGKFFYTPCEHCRELSTSHRLLGTLCNSLAKPHFFLFSSSCMFSWRRSSTLNQSNILFSAIMIATFFGIALVDTLWETLFKKPEMSENP